MATHPADAAARGVAAGDAVRVFNDRGACLATAVLSEDIRPGVIQLSTGAWLDPGVRGEPGAMCKHGKPHLRPALRAGDVPIARTAQRGPNGGTPPCRSSDWNPGTTGPGRCRRPGVSVPRRCAVRTTRALSTPSCPRRGCALADSPKQQAGGPNGEREAGRAQYEGEPEPWLCGPRRSRGRPRFGHEPENRTWTVDESRPRKDDDRLDELEIHSEFRVTFRTGADSLPSTSTCPNLRRTIVERRVQ